MKDIFGEIKTYLPKYLSPAAQEALFAELKRFPENIDGRIYSREIRQKPVIYQGDAIADLAVANLPNTSVKPARCLVLSNTCDINPENKNDLPPRLSYCPIIKFAKLEQLVRGLRTGSAADNYLHAVRSQKITSMMFLPKGDLLDEESVALLGQPLNCVCGTSEYEQFAGRKLVTLSDYGFYLFLFKLAVHFTRVADGVARTTTFQAHAESPKSQPKKSLFETLKAAILGQ